MKKVLTAVCAICLSVATSAYAADHSQRALGNMYSKALNAAEKEGLLGTL